MGTCWTMGLATSRAGQWAMCPTMAAASPATLLAAPASITSTSASPAIRAANFVTSSSILASRLAPMVTTRRIPSTSASPAPPPANTAKPPQFCPAPPASKAIHGMGQSAKGYVHKLSMATPVYALTARLHA